MKQFVDISSAELNELACLIFDQCALPRTKEMKDTARKYIAMAFAGCTVKDIRKILFKVNDDLGKCFCSEDFQLVWAATRKVITKKCKRNFEEISTID